MLPPKETGWGAHSQGLALLDDSHHFSCVSPTQSVHTQRFEPVETYSDPQRWYKDYFKVETLKKIQKAMLSQLPLSEESSTFQKCSCHYSPSEGFFQPIHLSWRQTDSQQNLPNFPMEAAEPPPPHSPPLVEFGKYTFI